MTCISSFIVGYIIRVLQDETDTRPTFFWSIIKTVCRVPVLACSTLFIMKKPFSKIVFEQCTAWPVTQHSIFRVMTFSCCFLEQLLKQKYVTFVTKVELY